MRLAANIPQAFLLFYSLRRPECVIPECEIEYQAIEIPIR